MAWRGVVFVWQIKYYADVPIFCKQMGQFYTMGNGMFYKVVAGARHRNFVNTSSSFRKNWFGELEVYLRI